MHYQALGPALFSFLPRLFGKRTVVTVQGLDWQRKKWGWAASRALRAGEWAAAHLPDTTIVVSQALERHFQEKHGKRTRRSRTAPCCASAARPATFWTGARPRRVRPLSRALLAGEKLRSADSRLRTDQLADETGARRRLQSQRGLCPRSGRRHQSSRIRFLDWVSGDAFEELLTNAALFVLPSDLEGLSLALLDAMGAGVCVLTSDIPENREVVDGVGFTFRAGDASDLERMLQLLMADSELRARSGAACRQRVAEQYLWPEITTRLEQLYLGLLGTRSSAVEMAVAEEKQVAAAAPAD